MLKRTTEKPKVKGQKKMCQADANKKQLIIVKLTSDVRLYCKKKKRYCLKIKQLISLATGDT